MEKPPNNHLVTDMLLASYAYQLPEQLIAQRPCHQRDASRLLVHDHLYNQTAHVSFSSIADFLPEKCLLVFNNTKVVPCRVSAQKKSGGKGEMFFLAPNQSHGPHPVLIRSNGKKPLGEQYFLAGSETYATIVARQDEKFLVELSQGDLASFLLQSGQYPIPPYIRNGESDSRDGHDYQTVYSKVPGAVAAPTAGLHFTQELLGQLAMKGHELAEVTLHVGAGTFLPVKESDIRQHKMHQENYSIASDAVAKIQQAIQLKRPIVAVGTTSLRTLESAWPLLLEHKFCAGESYATDIFIYPGRPIRSIHSLITNFHLPGSSLLMLVSAALGRDKTLQLYAQAIEKEYRFFSYGDAMLLKGPFYAQ